jgi:multisubunit Na+/H+ antiporter MnhB subunit
MTAGLVFDIGLCALLVAVAGWTVVARESSAAVVGFIVYGLLLAFVWVRVSSVDIALTEAAVGSGMTGMLLLGAVARTRSAREYRQPSAWFRGVATALCALVAAALAALVIHVREAPPSLAHMVSHNLAATGVGNPVTAVLMAFRAFDTFGEKVVLFVALIGVWSLAADENWSGAPGVWRLRHRKDVLVLLAQSLVPVGIVAGVFLLWVGADHPGGAFQGAAILAAMWLLAMMAGLSDPPRIDRPALRLLLIAGAALFLAVGLAGVVTAGAFLAYPPNFAKALIILIEAAMIVSVAATLTLLVLGAPERGKQP